MEIRSIKLTPARAPAEGIRIEVESKEKLSGVIRGSCLVPRGVLASEELDLLRGILVTAIDATAQQSACRPLVTPEEAIVFRDEIASAKDQVGTSFEFELDLRPSLPGPVLLHLSCFQYVSEVIWMS